MDNEKINHILNELKSADYCCKRIIELNQELEEMNHALLGLSHNVPRLTPEQEKSNLPMPTSSNHGFATSMVARLEEITVVESDIIYYQRRLRECKPIELLSMNDQNILFDLCFFRKNQYDLAEKYGFTRTGLWKHIRSEIGKLM